MAQVGTELRIDLNGTDPDGQKLEYGFHAADLPKLDDKAQITVSPSGAGVFRWTPLGADVGQHPFDFTVSDGSNTTTVTIMIDVRSAVGSATAPVFRQPLGTGTTLDLTKKKCVDVDVVVEDQDTAQVTIAQEEPVIEGATLEQKDGTTATWHWCPTKEQEAENRYTLVLSADDSDNPKTIKQYLVVLHSGGGASCPGSAPVIASSPADETTILPLTIAATVSDDKGIKNTPLVYVSTTQPSDPPDLSQMTQLSTILITGDGQNGQYAADVPNPVANMPAGSSATLFYVVAADDDDDAMGGCDHTTVSSVFKMKVTAGGHGNLALCAACDHDTQCSDGAECVHLGSAGTNVCLQSCAGGCPSGTTCSPSPVASVDGAMAMQCVPNTGSCTAPTDMCIDDALEENDTRSQASANPPLSANDLHDLVSCPSTTGSNTDDDFYKIVLPADSRVDIQLAGEDATDLDLHLYHSDGTVVSASTSFESSEEINSCIKAGTYYVKVNGFGHARNEYLLQYTTTPCNPNAMCTDDANEDDDTFSQARITSFPTHASTGNKICADDDDWYKVPLFTGDVMTVDLTFTQSDSTQDLDIHLYKGGTDLTPCDTNDPSQCSIARGQGATSNEHTTFTAPAGCDTGCDYFVVVRGYNHSANAYDINIHVQAN